MSHNQQDEFVQYTAQTIKYRPNPGHPPPCHAHHPPPGVSGSVSVECAARKPSSVHRLICVSVKGEAAAWISLKLLVCVGSLIIQVRRKQFVLCPSSLEAAAQVARVAEPAGIKASPRVGMKSPKAPPAGRPPLTEQWPREASSSSLPVRAGCVPI